MNDEALREKVDQFFRQMSVFLEDNELDQILLLISDDRERVERGARWDEVSRARHCALMHSMDKGEAIYAVLDKRMEQLALTNKSKQDEPKQCTR